MDKLEKISYDVKFEPTADGGSKNTMTSTYYTKGNIVLTEEEIKEGKEKSLAMYKVVENYLMQNPEEYASLEFSSLIKNKYVYKNALRQQLLQVCWVAFAFGQAWLYIYGCGLVHAVLMVSFGL